MKKEQIYQDLKKKILTMVFEPAEPLDEVSLCQLYSISRTPLRDIFRQLSGEGYITLVNNRGASVSSMSHKVMRDFFLTAPMIYGAIGRLAADNAKPEQIDALKSAQREFNQAVKLNQAEDMIYWNDQFHAQMGVMADNPYLKSSYDRLLIDHARISQTFYRPRDPDMAKRMQTAIEHHEEMIDAIEQSDGQRIVEIIDQHWALSRDRFDYFVHPDPLPTITAH